jgi:predicted NBD/HSP70 family sugar kinase
VALARAGHPTVVPMVRTAGRRLGEVLAGAVNFFNPSVIVLGGGLDEAHEHLIAGVREVIYQRSTSLATHDLDIVRSRLSPDAGVVGCAVMVLDQILSPSAVDARVADSRARASEVAVGG